MKKLYVLLIVALVLVAACVVFLWQRGVLFKTAPSVTEKTYEDYLSDVTPETSKPLEFSAWIGYWDERSGITSMTRNPSKIKTVMPFWYRLSDDGDIIEVKEAIKRKEVEETALKTKIALMPTIINEFNSDQASALFDNWEAHQQIIGNLVFTATSRGYAGWDLDLEEMYVGDKDGFNDFVANLADALHAKNLKLSVTVQAKTGSSLDAPSADTQDWNILAQHADYIRVMAYDYHNADSEAGPVTPLDLYEKTLSIAVNKVPLEKLVIALPAYGYDWVGEKGKDLQYAEAIDLLTQKKAKWIRDEASASLKATYKEEGKMHEVWFDDAEAARVKIQMAKAKGVYQFSFWRIGGEDPNIWAIQ